jgi:UDP-N-acetylglucosamine 4-epimerase
MTKEKPHERASGSPLPYGLSRSVLDELLASPRCWLVTGAAGFIGSNLVEALLRLSQRVVGLDNFATGHRKNLEEVLAACGDEAARRFRFLEGDIRNAKVCHEACEGVDVVLHHAALGSVPRSLEDPLTSHEVNVDGFVHMLLAARDAEVSRFVYASSSSVYGDHPTLPKVEETVGNPLSPYALTKRINEDYAAVFSSVFGLSCLGFRYFNVFGPRQDPEGPYAAVIPRWFAALAEGKPVSIYGDGETSRDFCHVDNVVQANLLAGTSSVQGVFNVAVGERITLNELYEIVRDLVEPICPGVARLRPLYEPFRPGDVRHSLADVTKAKTLLGYVPVLTVREGLRTCAAWYLRRKNAARG